LRSAIHTTFGPPAEVMTMAETPLPVPGPGQVRIRTVLAPIHNHDLSTIRGQYGYKPTLPAIAGSELAGVIDALGEGVANLQSGQRVAVVGVRGAWAAYALAPAASVVPLPDAISDETGCQLLAMPLSAIMLLDFLNLKPGQWFIQNAANGAVGKMVAMLAQARGLHAINVVRRDEGVAELAALGMANVVSSAARGWKDRVRALHGEAPLAAAVDSIGGDASGDLFGLLGDDGVLVSFGAMSGEPMRLSSGDAIFRHATVKGFWANRVAAQMSPAERARMTGELLRLVTSGALRLPVDAVFDVSEVAQAVAASDKPGRQGKILLRF
jgi:NADPH2:quinone reductase